MCAMWRGRRFFSWKCMQDQTKRERGPHESLTEKEKVELDYAWSGVGRTRKGGTIL